MLQRAPTYFTTGVNRNEMADRLRQLDLPEEWIHEIVRRDLLQMQKDLQFFAAEYPDLAKEEILKIVREHVGAETTEKHFTPSYRPWTQRIAFVPDGDLFNALNSGKADIVTDHIDTFTKSGIKLKSGQELAADVIITATGFNVLASGGMDFTVDGRDVKPSDSFTYRGVMLSDIPNFAVMFGYLRTSWTMRVDLIADYLCRLINHMDKNGVQMVVPRLRPQDQQMPRNRWIAAEEFNPGYMQRGIHLMPASGDREPWKFSPNYYAEKEEMPPFDLNEDSLFHE